MNRIIRPIKEGFLGVTRNLALSLSSVSSVTITLLLMSLFILLSANIQSFTTKLEQSVEIHVIVDRNYESDENVAQLTNDIKATPGVLEVKFSSKDEELEYFIEKESVGKDPGKAEELLGPYRGDINPFHHAFLVTVSDGQNLESIRSKISNINGVESASAGGEGTEGFMDALATIRDVGFIIVIALTVIAVFLIANTIRVSIHSRYREIGIMRTVGASNWYIRWPFIIEGMIIGFVGSIIPVVLTIFGYNFLIEESGSNFITSSLGLLPSNPLVYQVSLLLVGIGVLVGALGSLFSVGKFLRWSR